MKQTNATQQDLQTLSLTSLSFVYGNNSGSAADFELVNKTLNFVNNNIDSKLIELGLIDSHSRIINKLLIRFSIGLN